MTDRQGVDRELSDLLEELRVALPGVQILFAFLLTIPFSSRFDGVTRLQEGVYFVALLTTLVSSALLIAPTAYHRVRFPEHDRERTLRVASRLATWGVACLALALTASMFFITDFLFGFWVAVAVGATSAGLLAFVWFFLPVTRAFRGDGRTG